MGVFPNWQLDRSMMYWRDVPGATKCKYRQCERAILQSGKGRKQEYCGGRCRKNELSCRRRDAQQQKADTAERAEFDALGVPSEMIPILHQYATRYTQTQIQDTAWLIGRAIAIDRAKSLPITVVAGSNETSSCSK